MIAPEIVNVQPIDGPHSSVHYMHYVYGTTKGGTTKGDAVFDNPDKHYSSNKIQNEVVGSGDDSTGPTLTNLSWRPVIRGSVLVTDGTQVAIDNHVGGWSGDVGGGTISYSSGAMAITWSSAVASGLTITASYQYDFEASASISEMDLVIRSAPVVAQYRKLRGRITMEASLSMDKVYGVNADAELLSGMAHNMKFETDREIIDDLFAVASAGSVSFSKTPPPGVSYAMHKLAFLDALHEAGNLIYSATRRATGNFSILGTSAASIVETLEQFKPDPELSRMTDKQGVFRIGQIGNMTFYKDPYIDRDRFLVGHKGSTIQNVGYIYAPFIPFFFTQPVTLDDFIHRRGVGTSYALKTVNGSFYATGTITA